MKLNPLSVGKQLSLHLAPPPPPPSIKKFLLGISFLIPVVGYSLYSLLACNGVSLSSNKNLSCNIVCICPPILHFIVGTQSRAVHVAVGGKIEVRRKEETAIATCDDDDGGGSNNHLPGAQSLYRVCIM